MSSRFTLFIVASVAIFSILFSSVEAQKKNIIIEQHTGAWCGWCPDGTVVMDGLIDLYPDQIIGVKFHNGDAMVIPQQATIASELGLGGYPTGNINRAPYQGKVFNDRTIWKTIVDGWLNQPAKLTTEVKYDFDESTRKLRINVIAEVIETVNNQLSFNAWIIEDGLSGEGKAWDQSNYYSNNGNYPNHPYFSKPNPIVGYVHDKVVRACIGGAWGENGEFTVPAEAGNTYAHYFEFTVPQEWHMDNIKIVGLVAANEMGNKEIYNSAYGEVGEVKVPILEIAAKGEARGAVAQGAEFSTPIEVKNTSETNGTFIVSVATTPRTPDDWSALFEPSGEVEKKEIDKHSVEIEIPAGGSTTINLSLSAGSTIGFGDAMMVIASKDDPTAIKGVSKVSAISSEIENVNVMPVSESTHTVEYYVPSGQANFFKMIPTDFGEFGALLPSPKYVFFNGGATTSIKPEESSAMVAAFNKGASGLIIGNLVVSGLSSAQALNYFGLTFKGVSKEGQGTAPYVVWMESIPGHDITDGVTTEPIEGNLISYLLPMMDPSNEQKAIPFLKFRNNQTTTTNASVTHTDANLGIAYQSGETRVVLMSLTQAVIKENLTRTKLMQNVMKWIFGLTDVSETSQFGNEASISATPNPVSDATTISYTISGNSRQIELALYDAIGQKVKVLDSGVKSLGNHDFRLNASELVSGSYYVVLDDGDRKSVV